MTEGISFAKRETLRILAGDRQLHVLETGAWRLSRTLEDPIPWPRHALHVQCDELLWAYLEVYGITVTPVGPLYAMDYQQRGLTKRHVPLAVEDTLGTIMAAAEYFALSKKENWCFNDLVDQIALFVHTRCR